MNESSIFGLSEITHHSDLAAICGTFYVTETMIETSHLGKSLSFEYSKILGTDTVLYKSAVPDDEKRILNVAWSDGRSQRYT